MDYDYIVVGSGFGGSVSALRLAEKGYRVAVLEQGRRVSHQDMEAASRDLSRLFWLPGLGWHGFFSQQIFRHVGIVAGVGVGGGSLVYAAVLLKPKPAFFQETSWSRLGVDWEGELAPHYETAMRMLGRTIEPHFDRMDDWLPRRHRRWAPATPSALYHSASTLASLRSPSPIPSSPAAAPNAPAVGSAANV